MGKRELLLVIGFVLAGTLVYQATAPPGGPDERGLSFSKLIDHVRREVSGNRATAETMLEATEPVDPEVNEIRIAGAGLVEIHIIGEDRPDVASSLKVVSNAYDAAEARKYADETLLKADNAAGSLIYKVVYPEGRQSGVQRTFLTLKVPSRMRVRVEVNTRKIDIAGVAGVELTDSRGTVSLARVSGRAVVTHRNGPLTIGEVDELRLTGRNTELTLTGVRGDTNISMEQGGYVKAKALAGPVDIDGRDTDITIEGLETARGPIRIDTRGGSISAAGIRSETRIEGRDTKIEVAVEAGAPVAVYNEGGPISLTPPSASGYRLDALVIDGRIVTAGSSLAEMGLELSEPEPPGREARASGTVKGGGPTITIRATRGDLTLRTKGEKAQETAVKP